MQITIDLFPFLTESDLKELMLRTATRAKFRLKVQEMVDAKKFADNERMNALLASINAAITTLKQVRVQSPLPTATIDAANSIAAADAALEIHSMPPVSPTLMPSTDDIDAINLAADAHVSPPKFKTLAILGAIEAAVANRSKLYAVTNNRATCPRNYVPGAYFQSASEAESVSSSKFDVSRIPGISSVTDRSRGKRQRYQRHETPKKQFNTADQLRAGPSSDPMVPPPPASSPITAGDRSEEFAAALTLSLMAAVNKKELSNASKLTSITENEFNSLPPSHLPM